VGWALTAILTFIMVLFGLALWMLERGKGVRS
jgi:ABC-2 type transport system permease protein